jgi:hypothetical protein
MPILGTAWTKSKYGYWFYASGQIHIDTQGYRTWGPDHSRNSSMCNYSNILFERDHMSLFNIRVKF